MPDFGFVGASYVAASIYQDDQECINWYPEIDPMRKERGVIALYPVPGKRIVANGSATQSSQVRALWPVAGNSTLFAVIGNGLYSFDSGFNATLVGNLSTNIGPVSMKDNATSVYLVDGANRYFCTVAGTGFTQVAVTDGAFIGGGVVDIVDNFLVYNHPGTQTYGTTNAASTTSSNLNFFSKDSAPDNGMSLIVCNRELSLIGEMTTEVWVDAGLSPVPFQRLAGASMQHGTIAPFSVARLGEHYAMLSRDTRGQCIVIMLVGYQPQRISTHAVETAISGYARLGLVSDAIAYTYQDGGHEFYVLTFPEADVTWVYDLATELWHKRAWRDNMNVLHRDRGNCCAVFGGQIIVGDYNNGNLYALDPAVYTDGDGSLIPMIRRCPHLTDDLRRQFFHDLQIQFQPGVGASSGQYVNPQAVLEWSDDGGSTWSKQHTTSIGKIGKYKNRAIWRRLGQARDRIFQVTVTDPVNRVVVSANLNASAGAS